MATKLPHQLFLSLRARCIAFTLPALELLVGELDERVTCGTPPRRELRFGVEHKQPDEGAKYDAEPDRTLWVRGNGPCSSDGLDIVEVVHGPITVCRPPFRLANVYATERG